MSPTSKTSPIASPPFAATPSPPATSTPRLVRGSRRRMATPRARRSFSGMARSGIWSNSTSRAIPLGSSRPPLPS
eukprot:1679612-Prymnesium_polylepis.1